MTENLQLLYIRSNPKNLFSLDQGTGCSESRSIWSRWCLFF